MLRGMPLKAVMKILTGPPGTGKTFRAAREAVHAIDPTVSEADILIRHTALVDEGRIVWVTFHPSYTYEDFVEGIRPVEGEEGNLKYISVDGVFKKLCRKSSVRFVVGQKIGKNGNYIITSINDQGMTLGSIISRKDKVSSDMVEGFADYWSINRAIKSGLSPKDFRYTGKQNKEIKRVADQTLMPTTFWRNSGRHAALWDALNSSHESGALQPVVLVIDEINRADLSRVFGELMTLLELDKRAGEPEEKRVTLPYSGEQLTVPATLSIIGTMNTADRSLAVLDYALRRRFTFEEVAPDPLQCAGNYGGLNLGKYLTWMNRVVTALLSRDNRVGHVDLMQSRLETVREQEGWLDDLDGQLRAVAWTLRHKIAPLLLEYFHEDWRRASRALGQQGGEALLTEEDFSDIAGLDADLDLRSSYVMEDWWDPATGSWDSDRFRRYMLAIKDVGSPPTAPATTVAASAPPAPSTPTTTTAAPLPASDETGTSTDAAPAEQNHEDGADEEQSAQE